MDEAAYRAKYFVAPEPAQRFEYAGLHGVTLYFSDFPAAVDYYRRVLGPPGYVEGEGSRGWRLGDTWLTLLQGGDGAPRNMELTIVMRTPQAAEALQAAFIEAGAEGAPPSDQLMYVPVRYCPARDPFGTNILVYCRLGS